MLSLSSDLTAAISSPRRKPAILATVEAKRFGIPVLLLESLADTSGDGDCQLSLAVDPADEGALVAVRTNGTALDYQPDYPNTGSWTNLDTVSAGQGFQLAYDPVAQVFALAYGDGLSVKFRTFDGVSWSSSTTLVTEASNVGAVALAFDDAGDACAFYVIGTSTTLKRLRRTSGTWAVSGTTWSRTGSVANLTGLAAQWDQDYVLAVTGTEVTTTHRRLWAVKMGDTALPANAWSALRNIAEADAASGVTFAYPSLVQVDDVFFAAYQRSEAGDVAAERAYVTSCMPSAGPLGWWSEPRPIPNVLTTHGAAFACYPRDADDHARVFLAGPRRAYSASLDPGPELGPRIAALSYKITAETLRVRIELDDTDGEADSGPTNLQLRVGLDVVLQVGYQLPDGTREYGQQLRCNVHRLSRQLQPGRRRLIVEASGPWEAMERHRSLSAWTAPAATTRGSIFQRVAALAGVDVAEAGGDRAPSTAWTTDAPAFAIAANEQGSTTLARLLAVTPDFVRPDLATGGFEICGFNDSTHHARYALPRNPLDGGSFPLLEVEESDELAPNWVRLQGPDRYADDFFELVDAFDDIFSRGPFAAVVRDIDADADLKASDRAKYSRERRRQLQPRGRAIVPVHPGHELFDIARVRFTVTADEGQQQSTYRVVGLQLDYRANPPAGATAYTHTLDLATLLAFS